MRHVKYVELVLLNLLYIYNMLCESGGLANKLSDESYMLVNDHLSEYCPRLKMISECSTEKSCV